jgi:hypothetical protein
LEAGGGGAGEDSDEEEEEGNDLHSPSRSRQGPRRTRVSDGKIYENVPSGGVNIDIESTI